VERNNKTKHLEKYRKKKDKSKETKKRKEKRIEKKEVQADKANLATYTCLQLPPP
jgi:hypothetical protein